MNTFMNISHCARSICYRVEPLFTVKCLVLQISYLQDGGFLWSSYMMKLVENLQLTSSCPQHIERGLAYWLCALDMTRCHKQVKLRI